MPAGEHWHRFYRFERYAGEFLFGAVGGLFLAGIPLGIWTAIELLMGWKTGLFKFFLAVPVCLALGAAFAFRSYADERADLRKAKGCCRECGHNLRATLDRCPECGCVVSDEPHNPPMQRTGGNGNL